MLRFEQDGYTFKIGHAHGLRPNRLNDPMLSFTERGKPLPWKACHDSLAYLQRVHRIGGVTPLVTSRARQAVENPNDYRVAVTYMVADKAKPVTVKRFTLPLVVPTGEFANRVCDSLEVALKDLKRRLRYLGIREEQIEDASRTLRTRLADTLPQHLRSGSEALWKEEVRTTMTEVEQHINVLAWPKPQPAKRREPSSRDESFIRWLTVLSQPERRAFKTLPESPRYPTYRFRRFLYERDGPEVLRAFSLVAHLYANNGGSGDMPLAERLATDALDIPLAHLSAADTWEVLSSILRSTIGDLKEPPDWVYLLYDLRRWNGPTGQVVKAWKSDYKRTFQRRHA